MEERRNIDELVALYSLEETVRDIFVEGSSDKCFISWLVDLNKLENTVIYSIEDINVSNEILDKHGLPRGSNRSRVIATAMELRDSIPSLKNALFIVDRDYKEYISDGIDIDNDVLEYTDYNSLELYALNESTICKILSLVYGCYYERTPNYYFQMKLVLREVYSIRLTNEKLKWSMEWLDFKKYISVKPDVVFDSEKFIEAYLKKNSKWSRRKEFMNILAQSKKDLHEDCRLSVRGHDFTAILNCLLNKKFNKKKINKLELFEGLLLSSLDKVNLLDEPMFARISGFVNK